jgi:hypothetical protein
MYPEEGGHGQVHPCVGEGMAGAPLWGWPWPGAFLCGGDLGQVHPCGGDLGQVHPCGGNVARRVPEGEDMEGGLSSSKTYVHTAGGDTQLSAGLVKSCSHH